VSSQGSNPVGRGVDLIVKFDPRAGSEFGRMADLPIDTPNGAVVPIRSLADVRREQGPRMVLRTFSNGSSSRATSQAATSAVW
jgi:Cu/Ag efflux pump CusA